MECVIIPLCRLVPRATTRDRGAEAFAKLLPLLSEHRSVEIVLPEAELVSTSFLDELILRAAHDNVLEHLWFVVQTKESYKRLVRAFSMRHFSGKYRWSDDDSIRDIEMTPIITDEPAEESAEDRY